jgi:protein-disulfide isomerase
VKQVALRLSGSLVAVLGLWTLVWLPLVLGEGSAAEAGDHALGDPNAPVTIIEYASLTCPHCAEFHEDVLPQLKERYIAPGKVRLVYRDFPLDQRALAAASLERLGKLGGLTEAEMEACFADEELTNRILQTRLEAQDQHEISSTPTFIIDGKAYSGSRGIDEFGELIDPLLDES